MKVGILTTDNGPHPADKWAEQTAAQIADIITIEPNSIAFNELTAQKNSFETEVAKALVDSHQTVQDHEKSKLIEHGLDRLSHPIEPEPEHVSDAVNKVVAVAKTKVFGSHFLKPEVQDFIRSTIGSHFASAKHIERSWHADRNSGTPEAQAHRAKYHPGILV